MSKSNLFLLSAFGAVVAGAVGGIYGCAKDVLTQEPAPSDTMCRVAGNVIVASVVGITVCFVSFLKFLGGRSNS